MAHKGVCTLALLVAGCGDAERKPQMLAGASGNGFGGDGGSSATSGGTTSAGTGGSMPVTLDLVCDDGRSRSFDDSTALRPPAEFTANVAEPLGHTVSGTFSVASAHQFCLI